MTAPGLAPGLAQLPFRVAAYNQIDFHDPLQHQSLV